MWAPFALAVVLATACAQQQPGQCLDKYQCGYEFVADNVTFVFDLHLACETGKSKRKFSCFCKSPSAPSFLSHSSPQPPRCAVQREPCTRRTTPPTTRSHCHSAARPISRARRAGRRCTPQERLSSTGGTRPRATPPPRRAQTRRASPCAAHSRARSWVSAHRFGR